VITVVGLLLLAGQFDAGWHLSRLWPLILIVLGAGRFLSTTPDGRRGTGLWLLFIGGIFLLNNFRILTLHYSWPLFVVFAGLLMVFGRDHEGRRRRGERTGGPGQNPGMGDGGSVQS
jgi:hypothetical protein